MSGEMRSNMKSGDLSRKSSGTMSMSEICKVDHGQYSSATARSTALS